MSKKKERKKEIEETTEKIEIQKEEIKSLPSTEELLAAEKDKNLRWQKRRNQEKKK